MISAREGALPKKAPGTGLELFEFLGVGASATTSVFREWPATRPACRYNNYVNGRVAAISAAWYDSGKRRDESGRLACWVSAELPSL